ncbi:hypothetical protein D3C83_241250 [compost metagenome]
MAKRYFSPAGTMRRVDESGKASNSPSMKPKMVFLENRARFIGFRPSAMERPLASNVTE